MAFDLQYVGDLTQKFLALEDQFQSLKAEREFYLRQIACHAQFMGDIKKIDEPTEIIILGFIELFLKSNPQYARGYHPLEAVAFAPPKSPSTHFGGIRDDD